MRLKKTFIIFLITLILLNISFIYAHNINELNSNYFRIHIVANSDSIDDQLLKYMIAKQVNMYIEEITRNSSSKEESKKIIEQNIHNILNICNNIIKENNFNYSAKAQIGRISYEQKQKNNIYMSKGVYDSLKIIVGDGNGQNWWSLVYPTTFTNDTTNELFSVEEITYSFGFIEFIKSIF